MSRSYKLFASQVSGKEPKLLSSDESQILKGYNEAEYIFYEYMNNLTLSSPAYAFRKFIPRFEGVEDLDSMPEIVQNENVTDPLTMEWLGHLKERYSTRNPDNKFLLLENILLGYKRPNALDLKIGTRQTEKLHKLAEPLGGGKYYFKLNGCRTNYQNPNNSLFETIFLSKYFLKSISTTESIILHLGLFFFDGESLRYQTLKKVITSLKELILSFKSVANWKFYSASLCLFYDSENEDKIDVKLLDFGRSYETSDEEPDTESISGLEYVLKFLIDLENTKNRKTLEAEIKEAMQTYLLGKTNMLVVPEKKYKQYEGITSPTRRTNKDNDNEIIERNK